MTVRTIDLATGVESVRDYTPEELAALANTPKPAHQEIVASVMLGMKSQRMDIFRVLDTLQVDALTANKQANALAIMQAKAAMTALNTIDLSAYQTAEQMEQAIQLAYWAIVAQAPVEVQVAFNALVPR